MNTIKLENKKNTKIVAHRGCSGIERENTLPAFVAAGNRTYFGIETDVHKTKDGKYILYHDHITSRLTAAEYTVEEADFDTLRALPILDKDGEHTRIDLRMPTLEEYIRVCRYYEKVAVLELKSDFSYEELDEIYGIIDALGYIESTVFIAFGLENLLRLREKHPEVTAQYLVEHFDDALVELLVKHKLDLDIYFSLMTKERVELCHKNSITVNVWTVDDPDKANALIEMGVDMITSNILE